jgi:hypothetical protein
LGCSAAHADAANEHRNKVLTANRDMLPPSPNTRIKPSREAASA